MSLDPFCLKIFFKISPFAVYFITIFPTSTWVNGYSLGKVVNNLSACASSLERWSLDTFKHLKRKFSEKKRRLSSLNSCITIDS